MENVKYSLKICHLWPDTLNLYGDSGNISALIKRMEWRGHSASVEEINIGDDFEWQDYDIFFIGGGQDFEQSVLLRDLKTHDKGEKIISAIENGKVFLTICGGYQLLGKYYKTWDGKICDFLGAIDVYTIGEKKRMVGNFMFKLSDEDGGNTVIGFENHSGKTYLGEGVRPLGTILSGFGNNGEDGTEGARYKNVFATYSHGPILPKNPKLTDQLLKTALENKYGEAVLAPLDDSFENSAFEDMYSRLK